MTRRIFSALIALGFFLTANPSFAGELSCILRVNTQTVVGPAFAMVRFTPDPAHPGDLKAFYRADSVKLYVTVSPSQTYRAISPNAAWRDATVLFQVDRPGGTVFSSSPKLLLNEMAPAGSWNSDSVSFDFVFDEVGKLNAVVSCYM